MNPLPSPSALSLLKRLFLAALLLLAPYRLLMNAVMPLRPAVTAAG